MRKILCKKEIEEGERLPFGYAIACIEYEKNFCRIAYPIGIHLIVGLCKKIYFWFAKLRIRNAEEEGYRRGYDLGQKIGEQEALKHWDYLMKMRAEHLGKKFDGLINEREESSQKEMSEI